jgi:hypothetical protein
VDRHIGRDLPGTQESTDTSEAAVPSAASERTERTEMPRKRDHSSAIYGSVLAATVVVSSGDLRAPGVLALLLVVSGVVFWFAHVYAVTVAAVHGGWRVGAIRAGLRHEWPVAFAAIPPAVAALVCGSLPNLSVTDGVWAALAVAIIEQQVWGYAAIRTARLSGRALAMTILLNIAIGVVIVALKVMISHWRDGLDRTGAVAGAPAAAASRSAAKAQASAFAL